MGNLASSTPKQELILETVHEIEGSSARQSLWIFQFTNKQGEPLQLQKYALWSQMQSINLHNSLEKFEKQNPKLIKHLTMHLFLEFYPYSQNFPRIFCCIGIKMHWFHWKHFMIGFENKMICKNMHELYTPLLIHVVEIIRMNAIWLIWTLNHTNCTRNLFVRVENVKDNINIIEL
jgi:hypothetical protein